MVITEVQRQALREASHWHAELQDSTEHPELKAAWQQWLVSCPINQWAWQRVELMQQQFSVLPKQIAVDTLQRANSPSLNRRTVLQGLFFIGGAVSLGWTAQQQVPHWLADHRTRKGQQKHLKLIDGSTLILNTATTVDIRYDNQQRLIYLHQGELYLETAADPRPLYVQNKHAKLQALGTRFTVKQGTHKTKLTVLESAVEIVAQHSQQRQRVQAQHAVKFDAEKILPSRSVDGLAAEWTRGKLIVDSWPLGKLIHELQRYHTGLIQCDPSIASLRISGAYPINDLETTLEAIRRALPVRINQRFSLWTRITPLHKNS